jgi:hypothetical protein
LGEATVPAIRRPLMQTVAATFEFRNTVLFPTETGARNKQLPMIWPPTCCEMMEMVPQAAACSQASANQENPCCPPLLLVAEASHAATLILGWMPLSNPLADHLLSVFFLHLKDVNSGYRNLGFLKLRFFIYFFDSSP